MAITSLQEKENRKLYVPIRPGNRGGWSLFQWESVRSMPYHDREMYLGNSVKIGVLDKGGKWRKKDWFLRKMELSTDERLKEEQEAARKMDQDRINAALGITEPEDEEKLTEAEMQELMKKIKAKKDGIEEKNETAVGLGFDKLKVQIRAKPTAKESANPYRLQGNVDKDEKEERMHKKEKKKEKEKKEKKKRHSPTPERRERRHRYSSSRQRSRSQRRHERRRRHSPSRSD